MSWLNLNDSLNNIKGQLSSFASGVLTDGDVSASEELLDLKLKLEDLQKVCAEKDAEISQLRLSSQSCQQKEIGKTHSENESDGWDWSTSEISLNGERVYENCKCKEEISRLKKKIDILENDKEELSKSLEQLDADHQETVNKLITLKDDLQSTHNILKNDYADLKKDYGDVMNENLEKSKKVGDLFQDLGKREEELKHLRSAYQEQNELKATLIVENHKLKEDNSNLNEKLVHHLNTEKNNSEQFASSTNKNSEKEMLVSMENHRRMECNNNDNLKQNTLELSSSERNKFHHEYMTICTEKIKKYLENDILFENENAPEENPLDKNPKAEFSRKIENILKILLDNKIKVHNLEKELYKLTEEKNKIIKEKNFEIEKLLQNSEILSQEVLNKTQAIKDYEKECSQLMENNDLLISELQTYKSNSSGLQTISESNEDNILLLENQLETANKKVQELEAIISDLENSKQENNIEAETELLYVKKHLNMTGQELNEAKKKYQELLLNNQKSEEEKEKWHDEYLKLKQFHDHCDEETQKLKSTIEKLNADYENLEYNLTEHNVSTESLTEENETYKKRIEEFEKRIKEYIENINNYEGKIQELSSHNKNLESINFSLDSNLTHLQSEIESLKHEMNEKIESDERNQNYIRNLTEKLQNSKMSETGLKLQYDTLYKEMLNTRETKQRLDVDIGNLKIQIENLNKSVEELEKEKQILKENLQDYENLKEKYDCLQTKHQELEVLWKNNEQRLQDVTHEITESKQNMESTHTLEEMKKLKEELDKVNMSNVKLLEKQSVLEKQNAELNRIRNELIEFVQTKHQENVQYHNEIQRLNQILTDEYQKQQSLEAEINALKEKVIEKERISSQENHEEVDQLKERLTTMEEEKRRFAEELIRLKEEVGTKDKGLTHKEEQIKILNDKNQNLLEKCEVLAANLLQEQSNLQKVLSEYTSPSEREQSLLKELDRLRSHLVEMEEGYTQELLLAEQKNQEMLAKVNEIEQREKQSSSVYTSINIRANQQVETMQVQLQLVTNQRDELRNKLSDAEDQINKQNAALTNLQLVLEQFQKDKEKDVYIETERIRRQIKVEKVTQDELRQEITSLKSQLEASKQGLQAASRLNDQLENCKQQIASYKDKVRELQEKLSQSEEKYNELSTNTDAKVDKNLIKNLFIGFITSSHNANSTKDQNQILKIIATVLDFNQQESEKVKLNKTQQEGWLNSVLHPQTLNRNYTESKESLSEAFIRFLETESKPKVIPNLLPSTVNKPSGDSSSRSSSKRQSPILLSEVVLPTFADFAKSRSSSSILKDVLKDNS